MDDAEKMYLSKIAGLEQTINELMVELQQANDRIDELELRLDIGGNLADIDPPEVIILRKRVAELEAMLSVPSEEIPGGDRQQ